MAKKKKDDGISYAKIAKAVDGKVLDHFEPITQWIDTGILSLNYISSGKYFGGGVPVGRMIELYGNSASGKSLIGMNILKGCQMMNGVSILLDVERSVSKEFAIKSSKIDPERLIIMEGDTITECYQKILAAIKNIRDAGLPMERPIVIVYDSLAASPSPREHAETKVDMVNESQAKINKAGAGTDQPGDKAKINSKYCRIIPEVLQKNNATLVIINQIREKIGVMFGPTTVTPGGRAVEFYSSIRFELKASKKLKDERDKVVGVKMTANNTKNRCVSPFKKAEGMYLYFEKGVNPFGGLLDLLLKEGRIDKSTPAGTYKINEPWAGGKEIKFKSSKERNDVPYKALLECPALVDAKKPEDIEYYIKLYDSAIELTKNASEEDAGDMD